VDFGTVGPPKGIELANFGADRTVSRVEAERSSSVQLARNVFLKAGW
jgi:hypothetical protein